MVTLICRFPSDGYSFGDYRQVTEAQAAVLTSAGEGRIVRWMYAPVQPASQPKVEAPVVVESKPVVETPVVEEAPAVEAPVVEEAKPERKSRNK